MQSKTLEFLIAQKEILNSNSMPSHFIVKGNMVSHLRELASSTGALHHPESVQPQVESKLRWLKVAAELQMKRTRLKKRLLKTGKLSAQDIELELAEKLPVEPSPEFNIPPLFTHFTVQLIVQPPTRRRVDPPNLWPTLKALGDGLTDCGFWPDDSFQYMLETSFRYGGLSGLKGIWKISLVISEVEDTSAYVLDPDAVS